MSEKVDSVGAKERGFFNAVCTKTFKAVHSNVINNKVVDKIHYFHEGDLVYFSEWRPEGMTAYFNGNEEMFVFWKNMENFSYSE